jgi:hypothetical protein
MEVALMRRSLVVLVSGALAPVLALAGSAAAAGTYLSTKPHITKVASTVPANGDLNPYGTVVVPMSMGKLVRGDVLVSNFNNKANLQGTGKTIVEISPTGHKTLFAHLTAGHLGGACPGGVGLTTALAVLRSGWVIVGSLPTTNGKSATAKAGCLIVVGPNGSAVETISGAPINGPWDMTWADHGATASLFVTNVLNGTVAAKGKVVDKGTVARVDLTTSGPMPTVTSKTVIASGFAERTDPAALVIGPTGVALGNAGLYVASTAASRIRLITNPMTRTSSSGNGKVVTKGGNLRQPLGLTLAPDGHLLSVNGGNGKIVETTPAGKQVATKMLDTSGTPPGAGALFGLAVSTHGLFFVDDGTNRLMLLH